MRTASRLGNTLAVACCLSLWTACTSTPNPIVERVRGQVSGLESESEVQRHAGVQLYEVKRSLSRLEKAAAEEAETAELEHLAYLATRRMEVARAVAARNQLRQRVETLGERRNELRLQARNREVQTARTRAQSAESRAKELEQQLQEVRAEETDRGLVLTLDDILFDVGKSDLKIGSRRTLDRVAEFLLEYPERQIEIEGHTDSSGSDVYNQRLSEQRAQSVARYLSTRGVSQRRIRSRGFGESQPVASNASHAGRQQNRRVEIVLPKEAAN